MKQLIMAALFLIGLSYNANAQADYKGLLSTADDTLASAATANYPVTIKGHKQFITFQVDVTKTSGTVAGTINWQRSIIGTSKYVTVSTATITDGTAQYAYSFTPSTGDEYRVQVINATGSFTYQVGVEYRK